jgi:hypothetical protein
MEMFLIALLLLIGPLALVAGSDSRPQDTRDGQRWWPGEPRS